MEPISTLLSLSLTKLMSAVNWSELIGSGLKAGASAGGKDLWSHLKPGERKKLAGFIARFFLEEFYNELRSKIDLTAALPAYEEALKGFLRSNLPDLVSLFEDPSSVPDISSLKRTWEAAGLYVLPTGFDWAGIARRVTDNLKRALQADEKLRPLLELSVQRESADKLDEILRVAARQTGPDVGFDIAGYKQYLMAKSNNLQLSLIHHATYAYETQVDVSSVFVAQSARASAPAPRLPRVVFRRLNEEGYLSRQLVDRELEILGRQFLTSPVGSIVEMADSERRLVVLGDPGSGKTALLNYLTVRWCSDGKGRMPLRIDLREYARQQQGFINFLSKNVATFQLNASVLMEMFENGAAVLQCDGLDEIFDIEVRASVAEEIAIFGTRFKNSGVLITTRIIGYESSRLRGAGFAHATLIDFDEDQIRTFLALWHKKTERDEKQKFSLQRRLEEALQSSAAIRELAGNPLLLTMMAILNRTQDLPRNRRELYREASRMLVHEWDTRRLLPDNTLDHRDKEAFLFILAGHMQAAESGLAGNLIDRPTLIAELRKFLDGLSIADSYNKARELVVQLTERNFILAFAGADRFAFVHRTFLEYFCAMWFFDQLCISKMLSAEQFCDEVLNLHVDDPAWREVFCLLVGMLGVGDAEQIIRWIVRPGEHNAERAVLAARCFNEVRNRSALPSLDRDLFNNLKNTIRVERKEFDLPPNITEEDLDEFHEYLPRMLSGEVIETLTNVWRNAETFDFLRSLIEGNRWFVLDSEILAIIARQWPTLPEARELLFKYLNGPDADLRKAAIEGLASRPDRQEFLGKNIVETAMDDLSAVVQIAAFDYYIAHFIPKESKAAFLKNAVLSNRHQDLRFHILERFVDLIPRNTLIELCRGLATSDPYWLIRDKAIRVQAALMGNDPETLELLLTVIDREKINTIRKTAMEIIAALEPGNGALKQQFQTLAVEDEDYLVRRTALELLIRYFSDDHSVTKFVFGRASDDPDEAVRRAVTKLLMGPEPEDRDEQKRGQGFVDRVSWTSMIGKSQGETEIPLDSAE